MILHGADPIASHIVPPLSDLLATALVRLRRQTQYARLLAKDSAGSAELREWLHQAADCIAANSRPQAVFMPVTATVGARGVLIADRVTLDGEELVRDIADCGTVMAYLLTLDNDQLAAFEWLGRDYAAHHVQSALGNEVLFALGRHAHRAMMEQSPTGRLRRIPVAATPQCGQRRHWDPARVQALLGVFGTANPGVSITDTGCFQPLNSLLGLAVSY